MRISQKRAAENSLIIRGCRNLPRSTDPVYKEGMTFFQVSHGNAVLKRLFREKNVEIKLCDKNHISNFEKMKKIATVSTSL